MTSDRPWRVGDHYGLHAYSSGGSPVATFHNTEDARLAVTAVNQWHGPVPDDGDYWRTAETLHIINRKLDQVMTQASDNQAAADADVAQLTKALGEIRNLVDTLNTTVADLTDGSR